MNLLLRYPIPRLKDASTLLVILFILGGVGGAFAFPLSFLTQSNFLIGIYLVPLALVVQGRSRFNYAYLALMFLFGAMAYVYQVRMFYFFSLTFYMLWLIEIFIGRTNVLVLFLLAFMSPFFSQVSTILGFPLRLKLSAWAGVLLDSVGFKVTVEGNMMVLDGTVFTVDEACMGLNMLAISMLMGVFILAYQYRIHKKVMRFWPLVIFFMIVFMLNLLANLFRIMILVIFKVLPESPMHEVIGILCLIAYVTVPLYFIGQWTVRRFGHTFQTGSHRTRPRMVIRVACMLVAIDLLFLGILVNHQRSQPVSTNTVVSLAGFVPVNMQDGIIKLMDKDILIYVKPIPEFFTGEHTPLFCWRGSGYTFKHIKRSVVKGHEIYCGQLGKSNEELYTAWWYSNGHVQTIHQLDWRLRMLKGEDKFCLVNVTAQDEATLIKNLENILDKDQLTIHHETYGNSHE